LKEYCYNLIARIGAIGVDLKGVDASDLLTQWRDVEAIVSAGSDGFLGDFETTIWDAEEIGDGEIRACAACDLNGLRIQLFTDFPDQFFLRQLDMGRDGGLGYQFDRHCVTDKPNMQ
jgi:hypothetical protein